MNLNALVGSGDRIALVTVPILVVGAVVNVAVPSVFDVGGPTALLRMVSIAVLAVGLVIWAWSVVLILTNVPRGRLITTGPYALVKHPLYTSVAFLVLPWIGFLLNTWLGVIVGVTLYVAARAFAHDEEAELARHFGPAWDAYVATVRLDWV